MQTAALRDRLTASITSDHTLTLNAALLPEAGALAAYFAPAQATNAQVIVYGATLAPGSDPVTVNGTVTLLGLIDLPVVLTGQGDDRSTSLRLTITGIPAAWRLSDSFGAFPQSWAAPSPGESGLALQGSFLDTLTFATASLVASTSASSDGTIQPGLNLLGTLLVDDRFGGGMAGDVIAWTRSEPSKIPRPFSGTVRLEVERPPSIDLRVPLDDTVGFAVGSLKTSTPFLWLHTVTPIETSVPESRLELAARVTMGTPNPMEMTIATELFAGGGRFVFWGYSEDESFSLANGAADLASLLGLGQDAIAFPANLDALSKLYVRQIGAGFSVDRKGPDFLALVLTLPADPPWDTHIPKVSVAEVETGWMVSFGPDGGVEGYVAGMFRLGTDNPIDLAVRAEFPTFELSAELEIDPAKPFSVSDAITHFLDVPDLPEIDLTALYLWATPSTGDFSISGSLADDWSFKLGALTSFSITSAYFAVNRSAGAGFSGAVGGDAKIGSATLSAAYTFPGSNFAIGGAIPVIHLGELVSTLSDHVITLPDALDLTLTNSNVAITKSGSDYTFLLKTSVANYGTLFFEIIKTTSTGWGAAVGIDLSAVQRLGDIKPFDFLNQIDLTFERMILVLTSVDLPIGYTFPDVAPRQQQQAPSGKTVTVPTSIGAPKQGINFYAAFAFGDRSATRHQPLLKLYDFLSIDRIDVDVALQISEQGGNLTALLIAGGSADGALSAISGGNQTHHMHVAAYLGIKYTPGNVDVFLRGLLTLASPGGQAGDTLAFAMELGIEENGFYVAGSMTGSWANPFGVNGLTVSDAAVEIGADWDGIPTVGFAGTLTAGPFDGSIACVLNSVDPSSSVLAGALSDVRLGDVLATFVDAVGKPDAETSKIIEVLDGISISGVSSFTLPLSVATALDAKDLAAVAQAFRTYGPNVPLSPTPQATLLVVGTPGQAWFITDKTGVVKHYEVRRDGDHLTAALEAQLYFCPNPTTIASMNFLKGYQIYGSLDVFGFTEMTAVTISSSQGIALDERMSEIDLFDGRLRLRRAPGDTNGDGKGDSATRTGPYISLSTFTQPSQPPPYRGPHFMVSGALSFLGIVDFVLDITITSSGLHVVIDRNMFGADLKMAFDVSASPLAMSGGGSAGLNLNPRINLKPYGLGTYTVAKAAFDAALAFGVSGSALTAHASGDLSFDVPAFGAHLGPYHLDRDLLSVDQPLTQLATLFEAAAHDVAHIASDLYGVLKRDATNFVKLVKSGVITLDDSLDHVLQSVFGVSQADVTATTTCFATAAVAPRLRELKAAAADSDDPLDRLRQLRSDLGGYPIGEWLLNIYNTISEPMVHLYDYQPADPNDPTLKQVLDVDDGQSMYEELLRILQAAGSSQPITLSKDFVSNGLTIIAAVLDLADAYGKAGAVEQQEATVIQQGVNALLDQLSALGDVASQGLTYAQIKEKFAAMPAPPNPFVGSPSSPTSRRTSR